MSIFPLFSRKEADEIIGILKKSQSLEIVNEDIPTLLKTVDRLAILCEGAWIGNPTNLLFSSEVIGGIKAILKKSKPQESVNISFFIEKINEIYEICKDIKLSPQEFSKAS